MTEFDASAGRMPSVIERDGLSVLLVFAALVVTLVLQPAAVITPLVSLPSFRAPGSVAWAPDCLLSCSPLALEYFLLEPIKGFVSGLSDLPYLLAFTLSALLVGWLTAARRRAADALRRAQTDFARAGYDASVGTYRQTVLTAFQAVEDNPAALRILGPEAHVQDEAVQHAHKSVTLTTNGKDGGKTWHPIDKVFAGIYQSIGIYQGIIEIPFLTA
jgi:hypothetical protein